MLTDINAYDIQMLNELSLEKLSEQDINKALKQYIEQYTDCFTEPSQTKYFEAYQQGILSNLDRKSIEPIALHFLGKKQVRGMQQFFKRSKNWETNLTQQYQTQLAKQIADPDGFASVDDSCFVKKGTESAGVAHQYCGRLGKQENCQSGVFISYASTKGYGLVDTKLYLPKQWFETSAADKQTRCEIPKDLKFQTKNDIATQMLNSLLSHNTFPIKWVGCDAAFGSDQGFLDGLPLGVYYFASVKENQYLYLSVPPVEIPKLSGRGRPPKHSRALEEPVRIDSLVGEESIVWGRRAIAQGTKGSTLADIKCVRAYSCRKVNGRFMSAAPVWVYIRRYEDGAIKYFISNAPAGTAQVVLDRLATLRWSIEQCFLECMCFLGMGHYETWSYQGWYWYMLLVMVAHLFIMVLCHDLKKTASI